MQEAFRQAAGVASALAYMHDEAMPVSQLIECCSSNALEVAKCTDRFPRQCRLFSGCSEVCSLVRRHLYSFGRKSASAEVIRSEVLTAPASSILKGLTHRQEKGLRTLVSVVILAFPILYSHQCISPFPVCLCLCLAPNLVARLSFSVSGECGLLRERRFCIETSSRTTWRSRRTSAPSSCSVRQKRDGSKHVAHVMRTVIRVFMRGRIGCVPRFSLHLPHQVVAPLSRSTRMHRFIVRHASLAIGARGASACSLLSAPARSDCSMFLR